VYDIHSDTTLALLDRAVSKSIIPTLVQAAVDDVRSVDPTKPIAILFPDAGASERYHGVLPEPLSKLPVLVGDKCRDFHTGKILLMTISGGLVALPAGDEYTVIIVDDLCAYGGTFILATQALRQRTYVTGDVILVVAHCEESILLGGIPNGNAISHVYTSNSLITPTNESKFLTMSNKLSVCHIEGC
jgi:ribose-phosphate pyrophosphokinase